MVWSQQDSRQELGAGQEQKLHAGGGEHQDPASHQVGDGQTAAEAGWCHLPTMEGVSSSPNRGRRSHSWSSSGGGASCRAHAGHVLLRVVGGAAGEADNRPQALFLGADTEQHLPAGHAGMLREKPGPIASFLIEA